MYLNLLSRKEKELFLEWCFHLVNSDGIYSSEERSMMNEYRQETGLPEAEYQIQGIDKEEIVSAFLDSTNSKKRAFLLESIALSLSDSEYNKKEKEMIQEAKEAWKITDEIYNEMIFWVKDMMELYKRSNKIVNG